MKIIKNKIKNFILNLILTEKEKVIIVETLTDRAGKAYESMTESRHDLINDICKLSNRLKTTTKGTTWYNLED